MDHIAFVVDLLKKRRPAPGADAITAEPTRRLWRLRRSPPAQITVL
jgi:hypothetical protein